MRNYTLPEGVKDITPHEYAAKRRVENAVEGAFAQSGFLRAEPPVFERLEVFTDIGGVPDEKIYKFIDRTGSVLALRPDVTPQIARMASASGAPLLKYCYILNVYRYNERFTGRLNGFTQAGAEIYADIARTGQNSSEDAEIISVAISALIAAGVKDFRVDIGSALFMSALFDAAAFDEGAQNNIHGFLLRKDFAGLKEFGAKFGENKRQRSAMSVLSNLPLYIGGADVLRAASESLALPAVSEALSKLAGIYKFLSGKGFAKYVMFDLSLTGRMDYYTGVIFRGCAPGLGFSILEGGRCDKITAKFGKKMTSVGFAVSIDDVLNIPGLT